MRALIIPLCLALLAAPTQADRDHPLQRSVLQALEDPQRARQLELLLDDVHPLWGGARFQLTANELTRTDVPRAQQEPVVTTVPVTPDQLARLLTTLEAIEPWDQRVPDTRPVPDASRTMLTTRLGRDEAQIWEWSHELPDHDRLLQLRAFLDELAPAGAP